MNPTQLEIPQTLTIASALGKRRVRLSTLRPGMWIEAIHGNPECYGAKLRRLVLINSAKLQILVTAGPYGDERMTYEETRYFNYLGKGRPRRFLRYLPRWIARHFCPYAPPTRK